MSKGLLLVQLLFPSLCVFATYLNEISFPLPSHVYVGCQCVLELMVVALGMLCL